MPERTPGRARCRAQAAKIIGVFAGEAGLLGACSRYSDTVLAALRCRNWHVCAELFLRRRVQDARDGPELRNSAITRLLYNLLTHGRDTGRAIGLRKW